MTTDLFLTFIDPVLGSEGAYSNNPDDSGGETMWGITVATARAAGYTGAMSAMPRATAVEIYRSLYWVQPMFDQLALNAPTLAAYALNLGVNRGTTIPGAYIQRALNVLDNQIGNKLVVDGVFGLISRGKLATFFAARGQAVGQTLLFKMMEAQACVDYIVIAEKNPSQEEFEFGWLENRAFAPAVVVPTT